MQLSIWRQFSSNHSGVFWVVGTFATVPEAQIAFDELRDMLLSIDAWHRDNVEASQKLFEAGNIEILPPEKAFADKYQVPWPRTIDWTDWAAYRLENHPSMAGYDAHQAALGLIDDAVKTIGRNVIVHNPDQTWMTTQPFEGILEKLGGQTFGYDWDAIESGELDEFDLHTRLTFTAPDLTTAEHIESAIKTYLAGDLKSPDNLPPWSDAIGNFRKVIGQSTLLKVEFLEPILKVRERKDALHKRLPQTPAVLKAANLPLTLHDWKNVQIRRSHLDFTLDDLWFNDEGFGTSAMIAWLEVNRCTDIDWVYLTSSSEGK